MDHQQKDETAVAYLATAMNTKLARARAKGRSGWDSPECTQQHLSNLLRDHVEKGDPVDVANFCAFLAARGEGIAPRQCLAQIEEPAQPVAEICSASHDNAQFGERAIKPLRDISGFEYGTPLYAGAAPAAVARSITESYTLAEIKAKIASHDYNAELLLQHAMRLLEPVAAPALEAHATSLRDAAANALAALERTQHASDADRLAAADQLRAALAAAPQAPAAPSAIATQVIENLLQLARIVNTAVEDWGESFEDGSSEVTFHKEEADELEEILEFFDSLPDAPPQEGVIESGPLRAARVLRSLAAPAAPAVDASDDTALLDAMQRHRIALVPEFEGPWDAEIYNDDAEGRPIASGNTPREALRAALAAQAATKGEHGHG